MRGVKCYEESKEAWIGHIQTIINMLDGITRNSLLMFRMYAGKKKY
jgi:hypothetical protein